MLKDLTNLNPYISFTFSSLINRPLIDENILGYDLTNFSDSGECQLIWNNINLQYTFEDFQIDHSLCNNSTRIYHDIFNKTFLASLFMENLKYKNLNRSIISSIDSISYDLSKSSETFV